MTRRDGDLPGDDAALVSRRDVLRAGTLAAAAGMLTAAGVPVAHRPTPALAEAELPPGRVGFANAARATVTRTSVTRSSVARSGAGRPTWMHTWKNPISRLDAHTAHRLDVRFPRRAIMLTIDDGPHPVWTPKYLRLLAKHHVTATFSLIGAQIHGNAHLVEAAARDGHHLSNHTFHHPLDLPSLSAHRIRRELIDTTDAIVRASGFRPRQFRAPGGVWGPDVLAEVARQEMMPLGWDIDPRDWSLPGVAHIRHAMLAARPHDIILCHDGGGNRAQTYHALETVLPALLARDYTFVTLPAPQ